MAPCALTCHLTGMHPNSQGYQAMELLTRKAIAAMDSGSAK